ncbi:neuropilin-1-like isoform X5 [Saccostrea echinata]|uniref:neuropilin-1-like isoform X5 n=1 Tax=Saccostrea echinata TaxID=191078 RepID=UPI002A803EA7|nr:neuropilin-1-like isoform X5 [Saccostrea echinata]
MADRHGTALPLLIFISMFQPSLSDTLTCTSSVSTINLNPSTDPYKTYKYPATGLYPRTTTCKWLFQATDASSRITFEVTSIYVDCGDTLKFHDGTSSSASAIGSSVCCSSSSSCGSSKPPATTTGNSLFLQLDSDGTDNSYETGFTVTVVVGKDESNCSASGTFNVNLASTLTLTSPQFPDKYPISRNCTYTYTYSNGNVQFEFIYMKVELYSGTCFDSVEIFNGSSTSSPLIAKVCGDTVPAQNIFTSSGTSLTIKFSSDGQETKTGFLARVTPVDQTAVSSSVTTGSSSSAYITTTINNAGTTGTNEPSTVNDSSTTTETSTQQQYETSGNVEKETTQHYDDTTTNVETDKTSSRIDGTTTDIYEETTTQIQGEMTTSLPTESTTKVINLQSTTIKDTTKTEVTSQPTLTVGDTTKADVTSRPISVRDNNSPFIADSTDSNGGVIAAGVTVALVVIALFVAGGVILFKKKKKRSIDIYD